MALPLIAAGIALGAAVLHESNKKHYKNLEKYRKFSDLNDIDRNKVAKAPSDRYCRSHLVEPRPGSLVCCEVYNFLDHTGIWIDEDTIIELSNSGLVKAVSASRFLSERSGKNIFVACDKNHTPIVIDGCADRAVAQIFSYREYDLVENNCHRFVHYCLTGRDIKISRFASLNEKLLNLVDHSIFWDRVKYY